MKVLLYINFLLVGFSLQAQPSQPSEVPGKLTGLPVNGAFSGVKGPAAAVKTLNTTFNNLLTAVKASKLFAEPVGFRGDIHANISRFQPQLGEKHYAGLLTILLKSYRVNNSGFVAAEDEASSTIKIYLNPSGFFSRTAGFFNAYDERYNIPHPFQKIPMVDSTADYTEYSFKSYGFPTGYYPQFSFRIVTASDRPVFIPFTRQQYLVYLIAVENFKKKESEQDIDRFKKELVQAKANLASEGKEEMKKIIQTSINGTEEAIVRAKGRIAASDAIIRDYQQGIEAMPDAEKKMTAYMDLSRTKDPHTERLVAPGRREGYPLYVINPDFYDNKLPPAKTQAVMIAYWHASGNFCPEHMKEKVKRIYDSIDYHYIKQSLK